MYYLWKMLNGTSNFVNTKFIQLIDGKLHDH